MDCYSSFFGFELVDPYDDTHERSVQWAVGLEIRRHIDTHSKCVMTCVCRKIQTFL